MITVKQNLEIFRKEISKNYEIKVAGLKVKKVGAGGGNHKRVLGN